MCRMQLELCLTPTTNISGPQFTQTEEVREPEEERHMFVLVSSPNSSSRLPSHGFYILLKLCRFLGFHSHFTGFILSLPSGNLIQPYVYQTPI